MFSFNSSRYLLKNQFLFATARQYSTAAIYAHGGLDKLYRVDSISLQQQEEATPPFQIGLLELVFFRLGCLQAPSGKDVVKHQGSTKLIGTTGEYKTAQKLSQSWKDRNSIFEIDASLLDKRFIDVETTVKKVGTGFYTKIPEHEFALCLLPLASIKSIELHKLNQSIANPFYISPQNGAFESMRALVDEQFKFLENLYLQGQHLSASQRQRALQSILEQSDEIFQAHLGDANPYRLSLQQYLEHYGNPGKGLQLNPYSPHQSILSLLCTDGDALFMHCEHYKKLIGGKAAYDRIEKINQEHGYGDRYSYSFD